MRRRGRGIRTALVLGLLLLGGCQQQEEPPRVRLWALAPPEVTLPGGEGPAPLRFAIALTIPPQQGYQLYGDLAEALGDKIGRPVHLIFRRTFSEVTDLVRSRQAELAHLCSRGYFQGRAGKMFSFAAPPGAPVPGPLEGRGQRPEAFFGRKLSITSHDRAVRAVAEGLGDGARGGGLGYGGGGGGGAGA